MTYLSSASAAASYGPPGSSSASLISTLAILIPIMALLLIMAASPQVRNQVRRARRDLNSYLYGPPKEVRRPAAPSEKEPESGQPLRPAPNPETLSFDYSIYDEEDEGS